MAGTTSSDDDLVGVREHGAGEAAARGEHRSAVVPGGGGEVKPEHCGRRRGTIDREGASVKKRAAEDVEVGPDREGGEVAEAVHVGVTGHGGKRAPREVLRIEEVRRGDGGVLREDADEVREVAVGLAGSE